jgi:ribonuclease D
VTETLRHARSPEPPTRFVGDDRGLAELVKAMRESPVYCFDTEFHRERTYYARLALIQIAWPDGIAIVDPLACDPAPLAALFASPALAVVHAGDQDLEIIERACGVLPSRMFDIQIGAGFLGLASASLGAVVDRLLGLRLEKGDQLTDWMKRPLNSAQLHYAAGDVAHLIDCYDELHRRLVALGRWGWAEEECALALAKGRRTPVPEEAWWRLRQARQLRGRARGIAQCLAAWRESRAQRLDVPVRSVFPDLAIASIAQRPPHTRAELEGVRSLDSRHLGGGAAVEILEAVAKGETLPANKLFLPPGPQGDAIAKPMVALAAAYATERAHDLDLDPALLATRADIVDFLQEPPLGRLTTGWRGDLIGAPILKLASGEAALAVAGSSLVLEERSRRPIP